MRRTIQRVFAVLFVIGTLALANDASAQCSVTCTASVPYSAVSGTPVSFASTGTPCLCSAAATYSWTFGDGGTSTEQNPSHSYAVGGSYNWQLTVTSDGINCTKSGIINIASPSGVVPNRGKFTGTTSQGRSFQIVVNDAGQITDWSLGWDCSTTVASTYVYTDCAVVDGSFVCGNALSCGYYNGFNNFTMTGSFSSPTTVSGTVNIIWNAGMGCCYVSPTFTATNSGTPLTASALADTPTGDAPLTVNFTGGATGGTPPYSYSWNFGDCSPLDTSQNASHDYAVGNWDAVLTVTDSATPTPATSDAVVSIAAIPGDAVAFVLSAPATAAVGSAFDVTVEALDSHGYRATGYAGTVHFTSSDAVATLPVNYTFVPGDAGLHTFSGVTLGTPGPVSVTVTDTENALLTDSASITSGYSTTTTVLSGPNPSAQGQLVTLSAHVSSAGGGSIGGTVTFYDGATSLGSDTLTSNVLPLQDSDGSISTSSLGAGPHVITVVYSGDTNHLASTSASHTHYVKLSAPVITATASSSTTIDVSWPPVDHAVDYEVLRSTNNVAFVSRGMIVAPEFHDSATGATAYFYRVRARDAGGNFGSTSATDAAVTVMFTDPSLAATTVKAVHVTQLRTAVNAMRAAASLGAATFTDATLIVPSTRVKAVHVQELRDALAAARSTLGLPAISFADPTLTASTKVKAQHVLQLRAGVQ